MIYNIIIAPNNPATPITAQTHEPSVPAGTALPAAFFVALALALPVPLEVAVPFPGVVFAVTEPGGPLTSVAVADPAAVHPSPMPE